jgi:hypothetical protein
LAKHTPLALAVAANVALAIGLLLTSSPAQYLTTTVIRPAQAVLAQVELSGVAELSGTVELTEAGGIVTDSLIRDWRFDDGSGQALTEYVAANNGQLGTTAGVDASDPAWATEGLAFNPTTTENDQVTLGTFFNPGTGGDFSLMVVVHYDTAANNRVAFSQQDGGGTGRSWLGTSGGDQLESFLGGSSRVITSPTIGTGWHTFTVTYDSTADVLYLYLDGANETSFSSLVPESATGLMRFGLSKGDTNDWGDTISYGLFYSKRLVLAEVAQNHAWLKANIGRGITLP